MGATAWKDSRFLLLTTVTTIRFTCLLSSIGLMRCLEAEDLFCATASTPAVSGCLEDNFRPAADVPSEVFRLENLFRQSTGESGLFCLQDITEDPDSDEEVVQLRLMSVMWRDKMCWMLTRPTSHSLFIT